MVPGSEAPPLGGRVYDMKLTGLVGVLQNPAIACQQADAETPCGRDEQPVERVGKRLRGDTTRVDGNARRQFCQAHAGELERVTNPYVQRESQAEAARRVQRGDLEDGDDRHAEVQLRNRPGQEPARAATEPARFVFNAPEPDVRIEQHLLLQS